MSKFEFPTLEGWATVAQASDAIGVSRQAFHKILHSDVFSYGEVRKIGSELKPLYLVSSEALSRLLETRMREV